MLPSFIQETLGGKIIGRLLCISIYEWGNDPGTTLFFKRLIFCHKALSHQVFHSFYEEMERTMSPISTTTRNLFL
jgi:hypothetical protein